MNDDREVSMLTPSDAVNATLNEVSVAPGVIVNTLSTLAIVDVPSDPLVTLYPHTMGVPSGSVACSVTVIALPLGLVV